MNRGILRTRLWDMVALALGRADCLADVAALPAGVWASGETLIIDWGRDSMCSAGVGPRSSGSSDSPLTKRGSWRGAEDCDG
jgi:hypothetical protein